MLDGGLVKDVILFPHSHNQFAVSGVWSGGNWNIKEKFIVRHFRDEILIGIWRIVGIDKIAHKDAVAILSPEGNPHPIKSNDILVFGEGYYRIFSVTHTDLPIDTDRSIEIGTNKYHGIAILENGTVTKIIFFIAPGETIENTITMPVWWRGHKYSFIVEEKLNSIIIKIKNAVSNPSYHRGLPLWNTEKIMTGYLSNELLGREIYIEYPDNVLEKYQYADTYLSIYKEN